MLLVCAAKLRLDLLAALALAALAVEQRSALPRVRLVEGAVGCRPRRRLDVARPTVAWCHVQELAVASPSALV